MPQTFLTTRILSSIKELDRFPDLDVVDLSCGEGEVVSTLNGLGCRAIGTRYTDNDYIIKHDRIAAESGVVIDNVDLTLPLPIASSSFDVVLLTEVIEHLPSHCSIVHEIGRILRPGGVLILSAPNIHRLHSRLQFLLTGAHKIIHRRPGWDTKKDELYAHHITPPYFPYLHTLIYQAGLKVKAMRFSRFKFKHLYVLPLYPVVVLASLLEYSGRRQNALFNQGERSLRRWMTDPAMLFSEQLVIIASKDK